jgi:dihydroorotate dehydrogenase electron transfer subunit
MFEKFGFRPARIERVVEENRRVKSFYLHTDLPTPEPGQFYMVWLPGAEEIPIGASGYENRTLRLSVSREGETSGRMHRLEKGERLFLRGPFGRGFRLEGRSFLLVGGGYGMAPLIFAGRRLRKKRLRFLIGAKSRGELLFVEEARRLGEVLVCTEDGSEGRRGLVTEFLPRERFDWVLTCGPEAMMVKVLEFCRREGLRVQLCLERYMKCGLGLCGSCVLDPGLRVCVEGPVFEGEELEGTDFGRARRDASGRRETLAR